MDTDELLERIQKRASDPKTRTSGSRFDLERFKHDSRWQKVYPPVTPEQVEKAEVILGFKLPRLLTRLYVEVANGGFGPGYGLFGLEGGFTDEDQRLTLVELYRSWADPPQGPLPPPPWPKKLVPICDWGDCMMSCIDCAPSEGRMVFSVDPVTNISEDFTFDQWLEDWVKGVNLQRRAMRKR
jgi:hypothetical protein